MTATANTSLIMNLGAGAAANPSAGSRAAPKNDDQPRRLFETALNSHLQARQQAQLPFASAAAPATTMSSGPARSADTAAPGGNFTKASPTSAPKPAAPKAPPANSSNTSQAADAPAPPDPAPASGAQAGDSGKKTTTDDGDGGTVKKAKDETSQDDAAAAAAAATPAIPMTIYDALKAQGMLNSTPANPAATTDAADAIAVDTGAAAQTGNLTQLAQSLQSLVDRKDASSQAKASLADDGAVADAAQVAGGKAAPKTIQEVIDAAKALAQSKKPAELTPEEQKTPFTALAAKAADAAAATVPNTAKTFAELVNQQVARQENSQAQQPIQLMSPPRMADTAKVAGAASTAEADKSLFAVHVPVGADGWDRAIGQKVVMMVSNQRQEVEMQLNPPHLGPIDVKLSMKDGEASLSFSSNHAQVREALQASMPRLSEMMAENGIQLSNADVYSGTSQQQQQQGGSASEQKSWRNPLAKADDGTDIAAAAAPRRQVWAGNLPGNLNFFV